MGIDTRAARPARRLGRRYGVAAALLLVGAWLWRADVPVHFGFAVTVGRNPKAPGVVEIGLPANSEYVALSDDGRTLVCVVSDWPPGDRFPGIGPEGSRSIVSFWQVPEARILGWRRMPGGANYNNCLMSPDGRLFAYMHFQPERSYVALWRVPSPAPLWHCRYSYREWPAYVAGFSPDGRRLLGAAWFDPETRVVLWNAATGRLDRVAPYLGDSPLVSAWAPDGSILAVGDRAPLSSSACLVIYDARTGVRRRVLPDLPWQRVSAIAFSNDGFLLAATGQGRTATWSVGVWDVGTGRRLRWLSDRDYDAVAPREPPLTFLRDNRMLIWGRFLVDTRDPAARPSPMYRGTGRLWLSAYGATQNLALFSVWEGAQKHSSGVLSWSWWCGDQLEVWDIRTATLRHTWANVACMDAVFSPSNRLLAKQLGDRIILRRLEAP